MCLHIHRFSYLHTAKRDKVVYKGIRLDQQGTIKTLRTPYQGMAVRIGETYTSSLYRMVTENSVQDGLHSFKRKSSIPSDQIKVKCIIPKGAHYYRGTWSSLISYASDQLTLVEILK